MRRRHFFAGIGRACARGRPHRRRIVRVLRPRLRILRRRGDPGVGDEGRRQGGAGRGGDEDAADRRAAQTRPRGEGTVAAAEAVTQIATGPAPSPRRRC